MSLMRCPLCSNVAGSLVTDSRPASEAFDAIRRRRTCGSCKKRFSTYEIHSGVFEDALVSIKKLHEARDMLVQAFKIELPVIPPMSDLPNIKPQ